MDLALIAPVIGAAAAVVTIIITVTRARVESTAQHAALIVQVEELARRVDRLHDDNERAHDTIRDTVIRCTGTD